MAALTATAPAAAVDLNFDFKVNQGATGVTFATLSMNEFVPGTTTFTLSTVLTGGQGNPEIVELLFGCAGCGMPTFASGPTVVLESGSFVQAGYDFDFRAKFDPDVNSGNDPRIWLANRPLAAFLEPTSGAGPESFALIQLTGGAQTIRGQNITSGFYVSPVPEPETYAILLVGLGLAALALRRRRA